MFNTKLLEYMACGKPVIAGDIAENSYLLKNCGIIIPPCKMRKRFLNDYVSRISQAVEVLMDDEKMRVNLGKKAREKAVALFDWKKLTKKLYDIYMITLGLA